MNISTFVRSYMYEDLWSVETCLRADVSYFLCCTRKRDVCVTPALIVFQHPAEYSISHKL